MVTELLSIYKHLIPFISRVYRFRHEICHFSILWSGVAGTPLSAMCDLLRRALSFERSNSVCDDCEAGWNCGRLDGSAWFPANRMDHCWPGCCSWEHLMAGGRSSISPEIDSGWRRGSFSAWFRFERLSKETFVIWPGEIYICMNISALSDEIWIDSRRGCWTVCLLGLIYRKRLCILQITMSRELCGLFAARHY